MYHSKLYKNLPAQYILKFKVMILIQKLLILTRWDLDWLKVKIKLVLLY